MHVHNEINFPQAKLDSEINARFLLNGHGDLYFILHNNSVHKILLCLKKNLKKLSGAKKDIGERVCRTVTMTAKITTLRTLYVHVALNSVMFAQILYDIVPYARHFLPVKFFPK